MHPIKLLFLLFLFSQIALILSPMGFVLVIPLKLKLPLKTLLAYGLFKTVKKKVFRSFFRLATPFVLRRTDTSKSREMDKETTTLPDNRVENQHFQYQSTEVKGKCLERLICEVHATHPGDAMGVAESVIVDLVGKMSAQHQTAPSFEFHQAATIGHKSKDVRVCHQYFFTCPYNSQQILDSYLT